jgi:hypothetical protein
MTTRTAWLWITLAFLVGVACLATFAPDYLFQQGFPLDDAWIHAVYGRELARSGTLAFNPGVAATGSTSPLWSGFVALPHLVVLGPGVRLLLIKAIGLVLHLLTALLVYVALSGGSAPWLRLAGAALVAFHPDLISASVSGMEVPLATLLAVSLVYAVERSGTLLYGALSAATVLARPELIVLALVLPWLRHAREWRRAVLVFAGAALGVAGSFGILALRNVAVSGLPLPATFYAKVGAGTVGRVEALSMGFSQLMAAIPVADSSILLVALGVASALVIAARARARHPIAAACCFASGLIFCATSFLLVAPIDSGAFYHQRYILPALPLLVASVPALAGDLAGRCGLGRTRIGFLAVLTLLVAASLLIDGPGRYRRLSSDARNIDDVQVALGRFLSSAPPSHVVWAIDAGAIRYFGNAFVVDLMGLNTPAMLGAQAQRYLNTHRPSYIEVVPGWSSPDEDAARRLPAARFAPSTEYTVTSFAPKRDHWLLRCDPQFGQGRLQVLSRSLRFECAGNES